MSGTESHGDKQLPEVVSAVAVPDKFKTKATRLLLRLIAGTVGARVFQEAQEGLDTIKGRSIVNLALAEEVAREARLDPTIMDIARIRFLGEEYRKQENLQAVAQAMQEQLNDTEQTSEEPVEDIDQDWLNVFSRFAEDASSARMQRLWGRVLSGEFIAPGKFSLRTLRFVSELDQKTAEDFSWISDFVVGGWVPREGMKEGDPLMKAMRLESAGLLIGTTSMLSFTVNIVNDTGWNLIVKDTNKSLIGEGPSGTSIEIPSFYLTSVGQELLHLVHNGDNVPALKRLVAPLVRGGLSRIALCDVVNETRAENIQVIYPEETFLKFGINTGGSGFQR